VSPRAVAAIALAVLLASLAACVPWTVRPIHETTGETGAAGPKAFVEQIWDSKLIPAIGRGAIDLNLAGPELARKNGLFVCARARGRILRVDTSSRAGFAEIDFPPYDGRADAFLALGPVIRGTAVRDASGLIRFDQFVNQLAFADVNNALNDRVVERVIAPLRDQLKPGTSISILGAYTVEPDARYPFRPTIVPVRITVDSAPGAHSEAPLGSGADVQVCAGPPGRAELVSLVRRGRRTQTGRSAPRGAS
jgi:predicted lipoprotein